MVFSLLTLFPLPNISDTDTFFRYQIFPIPVPIPPKKMKIPGTGNSRYRYVTLWITHCSTVRDHHLPFFVSTWSAGDHHLLHLRDNFCFPGWHLPAPSCYESENTENANMSHSLWLTIHQTKLNWPRRRNCFAATIWSKKTMLPIDTSSLNDDLARPALLSILVSGQFGGVEGKRSNVPLKNGRVDRQYIGCLAAWSVCFDSWPTCYFHRWSLLPLTFTGHCLGSRRCNLHALL